MNFSFNPKLSYENRKDESTTDNSNKMDQSIKIGEGATITDSAVGSNSVNYVDKSVKYFTGASDIEIRDLRTRILEDKTPIIVRDSEFRVVVYGMADISHIIAKGVPVYVPISPFPTVQLESGEWWCPEFEKWWRKLEDVSPDAVLLTHKETGVSIAAPQWQVRFEEKIDIPTPGDDDSTQGSLNRSPFPD